MTARVTFMKNMRLACCDALSVLLVGGAFAMYPPAVLGLTPVASAAVAGLPDFTELIEKVGPAVVNIRTTERIKQGQGGPSDEEVQEFLRRFFGGVVPPVPRQQGPRSRRPAPPPQDQPVQRGVGSGFIISGDGYVLTNAHVVDGADEVYVTLTDHREFKARLLGADARTDVALLKIDGAGLPRLTLGDAGRIRAGEWVIAIGSPFNLENTVTAGIISAKSRDTGDYLALIQSDVAVNPGNSGGPLINMRGEVIGINSQIATLSGGYNGISFAVPIGEAIRVANQLKTFGKVTRGRIGVQIGEVSKDIAESLGLKEAQGAQVSLVEPGGPAERSGIQPGDIILKFNGVPIERSSDLPRLVGSAAVGARATVTIWRRGVQQDLPVTVIELEDEKSAAAAPPKAAPPARPPGNVLGLTVSELGARRKTELGLSGGVVIEASAGPAARAGLQQGDLILQVNTIEIRGARQFEAVAAQLDPRKPAALLVRRGDVTQYIALHP
jgi:serine protease Do